MGSNKIPWFALGIALGALALFAPPHAFAQGCALCYTQAASSGARMINALRDGILILVLPPTLMTVGVAVVAYRRRNHFYQEQPPSPEFPLEAHDEY